jgi:hypothetical protein
MLRHRVVAPLVLLLAWSVAGTPARRGGRRGAAAVDGIVAIDPALTRTTLT